MFARNSKNILQMLAIAGGNIGAVLYATRQNHNHEEFKKLPLDEQKRQYDACPLNKMGTTGDAIAAMEERVVSSDPVIKSMQPTVPFEKAYPQAPKAESSATPDPVAPVSKWWHTPVSASFGGSAVALVWFPFEGTKKRLQSGQPISFKPRELYRGATSFSASVTIATVTQMTFDRLFKSIPGYQQDSPVWNASSAVASGVLGALVGSTPVENIILTQQLNKTGPIQAMQIMLKQGYTRPWVGLPQLAAREAGFGLTMLWGAKAAHDYTLAQTQDKRLAQAAEITAALGGAAATHPADMVGTLRQHANGKLSTAEAVKTIYEKAGIKGFYKGFANRALLFTGCAMLIPRMSDATKHVLETGSLPKYK